MLSRKEIGEKIKEKRLLLGLTQTELATKTLTNYNIILELEKNTYKTKSWKSIRRICKILEIEID